MCRDAAHILGIAPNNACRLQGEVHLLFEFVEVIAGMDILNSRMYLKKLARNQIGRATSRARVVRPVWIPEVPESFKEQHS